MKHTFADLPDYKELIKGDYLEPSIYIAAAKEVLPTPTEEWIRDRLAPVLQRKDISSSFEVIKMSDNEFKIILVGDGEQGSAGYLFTVTIRPNDTPEIWQYDSAEYGNRGLFEDERLEMSQATHIVECFTYLIAEPQAYLMIQLAVLSAIAGESYAVIDTVTWNYFSGSWLAEMAETYTPPNPELYYCIHAVGDPEDKDENNCWLHTHGLLKFGLPELEVLRANRNSLRNLEYLINSTATQLFSDADKWQEEKTLVAFNEQGEIHLSFMPWQEAITSELVVPKKGFFSRKTPAFTGDMDDRDEVHSKPSMALFANIEGHIQPISALPNFANEQHMMTYLSNAETGRMANLAAEKWHWLEKCFKRYPTQAQQWDYIVKVYCQDPEDEEYGEHMWFDLLEINGEQITARLINEPFHLPHMKLEEVYQLSIERITDWQIYSTPLQAIVSPDYSFMLRRYLTAN